MLMDQLVYVKMKEKYLIVDILNVFPQKSKASLRSEKLYVSQKCGIKVKKI